MLFLINMVSAMAADLAAFLSPFCLLFLFCFDWLPFSALFFSFAWLWNLSTPSVTFGASDLLSCEHTGSLVWNEHFCSLDQLFLSLETLWLLKVRFSAPP